MLIALPARAGEATVAGRKVAYREWGAGDRVLVMLSGLGDGAATFDAVGPKLAKGWRVIAYDRAGYGGSADDPAVHDAARAEAELKGLLAALGVKRPVLLGHSLGGVFAAYYAARNPGEVEALVLEETRPTGFTEACAARLKFGCTFPPLLKYVFPAGGRREAEAIAQSEREEAETAGGATPTLILTRRNSGQGGFDGLWLAQQAKLLERWPAARLEAAPRGGHYVHRDAQDWFVGQVTGFLGGLPAPRTSSAPAG
ncbi:alpha/beta hydrolase [uncultured Caulobacter sp.]|uniref:alpha/beta fold hydrolase n=2 Tax=Pseudomonadota TaxID=1224 RepID=UPI00262A3DC5|nr:alpha/beta hydrolase [uncultured Caulobacter sp.]